MFQGLTDTRYCYLEQELKGELPRAGHTATEVGRHIIFAGGILLQGRATMDVIILDAANYSMHRSGLDPASGTRNGLP